jgi:hypothetical protein
MLAPTRQVSGVSPMLGNRRVPRLGTNQTVGSFSTGTVHARFTCLYHRYAPRSPPEGLVQFDLANQGTTAKSIEQMGENFRATNSTKQDFLEWFTKSQRLYAECGPLKILMNIIAADLLDFLELVETYLVEIRNQEVTDTIIRERLSEWQSRLAFLEKEIPSLQQNIAQYAGFAHSVQYSSPGLEREINLLSYDVQNKFASTTAQIRLTSQSILTNLTIADSRRSMTEAHSLTKLTELAFIFIPLSFASSVLSMQITELSNGVSISTFFALALAFLFAAYMLRLIIRSKIVGSQKAKLLKEIRQKGNIPRNKPIRTTQFALALPSVLYSHMGHVSGKRLKWIYKVLHIPQWVSQVALGVILTSIILASPMAFLWMRDLQTTFKAMITIVVFFSVFPLSFTVLGVAIQS